MRLIELSRKGYYVAYTCLGLIAFTLVLSDLIALREGAFSPYILFPLDSSLAVVCGYITTALLIIGGAPLLIYYRRLNNLIENIPALLHDLTASIRSGATLVEAITSTASRTAYGELGRIMSIIASRIKAGSDVEDAIMELTREVKHSYVEKLALILVYAYRAGEQSLEMLRNSARMYEEMVNLRLNYVNRLRPYITTIGFMFFVFLFSSYIIVKIFVPGLAQASGIIRVAGTREMIFSLYWLGYFICIFTGAFYTKMVYGSYMPGLVYSALMLLVLTVFFSLFIFGNLTIPLLPAMPTGLPTLSPSP